RRVRHIRYHRELKDADLIEVRSGLAFDGPHMLTVIHEMLDPATGTLAATAIDGYDPGTHAAKSLRDRFAPHIVAMPEHAAPRGLGASPAPGRTGPSDLESQSAQICFRGTVMPRHLGPDNKADDGFALSAFTDGVVHVWQRTPMNHAFLTKHGYGRVAVEMKLTWHSPLKNGEAFYILTGFTGCREKTFSFRHHMFEARTDRLVACLDVVALVLDLKTRKSVALPGSAMDQIRRQTISV
ncbi:thioesterase family protein, partial [Roseibium hamelinense]